MQQLKKLIDYYKAILKYCSLCFCILSFSLTSCVKDKPNPSDTELPNSTHNGLLLIHEGAYGNNSAEIGFWDIVLQKSYSNLYQTANAKKLGDVLQSVVKIKSDYYAVLNGSNKIVVLDKHTFVEKAIITSIPSPRYILQVSEDKAYVSSLYESFIYIIDLNSNKKIGAIPIPFPNTEKMLCLDGYAYITNWDTASKYLYKIDTQTDSLVAEIALPGNASHDIVMDKNKMLWVLSGNKYKNKISFLAQVNPSTNQVLKSFSFSNDSDPLRLIRNTSGDTLYFLQVDYFGMSQFNGVFKMGIYESTLPAQPFIQANENSYFWGIGIDSITQQIFVSDPKGFTQQSTIYQYGRGGNLLNEFKGGIGTNGFLMK
jgi:DNA-binding beta-propeller fold protein YncE